MSEISEEMLNAGQHVLSEWLNDSAPIGEARYRAPAKACFEAMLALAVPTMKVKPLEWISASDDNYRWIAASCLGEYRIYKYLRSGTVELTCGPKVIKAECDGIEEAKAVGQHHYEASILSTLIA